MNAWFLVLVLWSGSGSSISIPMMTKDACIQAGTMLKTGASAHPNWPRIDYAFCVDGKTGDIAP